MSQIALIEEEMDIEIGEGAGVADGVEEMLHSALEVVTARLVARRAQREALNAEVRQLVAEQEVLRQALRPFEHARKEQTHAPA